MPPFELPKIDARTVARAYGYSFLGWGAFALLMSLQDFVLMRSYNPKATFWQAMVVPVVRGTTTALLTPALYFAVLKWPFSRKRFWISLLRYLGLAAGFIVAFSGIRWVLFPGWNQMTRNWVPRSFESLIGFAIGGFADQVVLCLIMVIVAHTWAIHRESERQVLKQIDLQRELAELQLQLLQMQLHPHFIFNTLHGITTLMERDVDTARTMLLHLADLLRAAISSQSQDLIPLRQEITFISSYVALEQMRLGPKLEVKYQVEEAAKEALVPHMILQPIVENAILHGAAACREGGWVEVLCHLENKAVVLEVANSATVELTRRSDGLGLPNTRARLHTLFEQDAQLDFDVRDGIARARIQFPYLTAREAVAP